MTTLDTVHAAPPAYVAPPTPDGHRFGLFSVASMPESPNVQWEVGVEWESLAQNVADLVSLACEGTDEAGVPLNPDSGVDTVRVLPFGVYGSYDCSVFSRPLDEAVNRARQHLALGEERAVEFAIATGGFDHEPTFQGATDLTPAGGAVDVHAGVGHLESYLAKNHAGVGTIHAPRILGPYLPVEREGQRLETKLGTLVAAGGGYDIANRGPGGATPPEDERWLYATGRPIVRRSDVLVTPDPDQLPNRSNNDVTVFAQRIYAVGWDTAAAAIRVQPDYRGALAPVS